MPGPAVRVDGRIGGLCQSLVRLSPLLDRCGAVDRRADQRVTEHHPRSEVHQAPSLGSLGR